MSERYVATVSHVVDAYTVVINAGERRGVALGMKFLIVGFGDPIFDPETNEELERLEIVRGKAEVIHLQEKIATLRSSEYTKRADIREITKVSGRGGLLTGNLLGPQDTITESIKPGEQSLKDLTGVAVGDRVIAL